MLLYAAGAITASGGSAANGGADALADLVGAAPGSVRLGGGARALRVRVPGLSAPYGPPQQISPWYYVNETAQPQGRTEILGRFAGSPTLPALVRWTHAGHRAVFSAAPALPTQLWRDLARSAGVNCYLGDSDAVAEVGGGALMVRGASSHWQPWINRGSGTGLRGGRSCRIELPPVAGLVRVEDDAGREMCASCVAFDDCTALNTTRLYFVSRPKSEARGTTNATARSSAPIKSDETYQAAASPLTPNWKPLWDRQGVYDMGPCESTPFWWPRDKRMYLLEGICFGADFDNVSGYWGHAGLWDKRYDGHSYMRIRDLKSGAVVTNITSSIGFGVPSAFVDYDHQTLWVSAGACECSRSLCVFFREAQRKRRHRRPRELWHRPGTETRSPRLQQPRVPLDWSARALRRLADSQMQRHGRAVRRRIRPRPAVHVEKQRPENVHQIGLGHPMGSEVRQRQQLRHGHRSDGCDGQDQRPHRSGAAECGTPDAAEPATSPLR